jgi:hypothetical protein
MALTSSLHVELRARCQSWLGPAQSKCPQPFGVGWRDRLYLRLRSLARIPEGGLLCGDYRHWGRWRFLYLIPFLVARRLLIGRPFVLFVWDSEAYNLILDRRRT